MKPRAPTMGHLGLIFLDETVLLMDTILSLWTTG